MPASNKVIDTIIVGQGLAGSMLAWHLMEQGQKVLVVSDESGPSASRVAAGLFNPVTGKRLVLQDRADIIIPAANKLYRELEKRFSQGFFHEKPMLRIIANKLELNTYEKRCSNPDYQGYLGNHIKAPASIKAPEGAIEQLQTGHLDTNALLDCLKQYLIEQDAYHPSVFKHTDIRLMQDGVEWQEFKAARIIFCEGFKGMHNPWFSWLPFQPAKGEILSLQTAAELPDRIINGGKWLLPIANGHYKTGATYEHDLSDMNPSTAGRDKILAGMQQLLHSQIEFTLLDHQAGVRPNTLDKHPFIGMHPEQSRIGIFNGFGSKGSMLIPWYSKAFANHLTDGSPIPAESDIGRVQHG